MLNIDYIVASCCNLVLVWTEIEVCTCYTGLGQCVRDLKYRTLLGCPHSRSDLSNVSELALLYVTRTSLAHILICL